MIGRVNGNIYLKCTFSKIDRTKTAQQKLIDFVVKIYPGYQIPNMVKIGYYVPKL